MLRLILFSSVGTSPLSIAADLIIDVLDIDDNCPVFNPKEYNVTIEENVAPRTNITRVYAKDVDTVGGNLDYGIRSGNIGNTFLILSDTGKFPSPLEKLVRKLVCRQLYSTSTNNSFFLTGFKLDIPLMKLFVCTKCILAVLILLVCTIVKCMFVEVVVQVGVVLRKTVGVGGSD